MGYRITIGNAVPRTYTDKEDREDKKECGYSDRMVEVITLPDAPIFLESDRDNTRSHSGRNWGDFADRVGLTDYFENRETGLSVNCPMLRPITQDEVDMLHRQLTLSALKRLRFLNSPKFELQRRSQSASTDSI